MQTFWLACIAFCKLYLWILTLQPVKSGAILPGNLQPGTALAESETSKVFVLQNAVLSARISIKDTLQLQITNLISKRSLLPDPAAFQIEIADGSWLTSNDFEVLDVNLSRVEPQREASQLSLRDGGWRVSCLLQGYSLQAQWSVELRDDSNSVKLAFHIWEASPSRHSVPVRDVRQLCLLTGSLKDGKVAGKVQGVPIVSEDFFLGVEHPQAINSLKNDFYKCCLQLGKALALQALRGSLTLGVVVPGQSRRSFLHYLERERAHPSRRMLHYNTWYDIGTGQQFTAAEAETRLQQISQEMGRRGVTLDAFLLDDGWDDPDQGPWKSHAGFSADALAQLEKKAEDLKTTLGVWFSPFGGYHESRRVRVLIWHSLTKRSVQPVFLGRPQNLVILI